MRTLKLTEFKRRRLLRFGGLTVFGCDLLLPSRSVTAKEKRCSEKNGFGISYETAFLFDITRLLSLVRIFKKVKTWLAQRILDCSM